MLLEQGAARAASAVAALQSTLEQRQDLERVRSAVLLTAAFRQQGDELRVVTKSARAFTGTIVLARAAALQFWLCQFWCAGFGCTSCVCASFVCASFGCTSFCPVSTTDLGPTVLQSLVLKLSEARVALPGLRGLARAPARAAAHRADGPPQPEARALRRVRRLGGIRSRGRGRSPKTLWTALRLSVQECGLLTALGCSYGRTPAPGRVVGPKSAGMRRHR